VTYVLVPTRASPSGGGARGSRGYAGRAKVATVGSEERRSVPVSDHVYGMSEIVGSSTTSIDEAIRTAVRKAARTVRNIDWFEVDEIRGHVVDGDVAHVQVRVKLGFRIE
jgi:flavin-binding protein dodecin